MESTRSWAEELLGHEASKIRETVVSQVIGAHEDLANAFKVSNMQSREVYGSIWKAASDRVAQELLSLPGASKAKIPGSRYRLTTVNNVLIYPWRYGRDLGADAESVTFAKSPFRFSIFNRPAVPVQMSLDFEGVPAIGDGHEPVPNFSGFQKVIIVAYASRPEGILEIQWGVATVDAVGCLAWGEHESIWGPIPEEGGISVPSPQDEFSAGPIPSPLLLPKKSEIAADED